MRLRSSRRVRGFSDGIYPSLMLQHYVFLKFHPGTSEAHVEEFCQRMLALRSRIACIEQLQVGRDVVRDARSWDLMLSLQFASLEALRQYQRHPEHQQVMAFNASALAAIGTVDCVMP